MVSCQAVSESITNTALRERAAAQGSTPRCSRPPLPPPPPLHMDQPPPLEPSPWPTTPLSLNSPPTSDKAGSLGHTVGPVFSVSFNVQCTLFTVFLTLPLQSGQGVSIIEKKTSIEIKGWAPTAESRTFEVCYIYICSKLQLVILFFWGRVIHCGATKTYCVTMPWTQGAVWRSRGRDIPQTERWSAWVLHQSKILHFPTQILNFWHRSSSSSSLLVSFLN